MRLGYARVSTDEQTLTGQVQRLSADGCEKLFEEKISGAARNRPKLEKLIEHMRKGDVLVVTRLDRLARSTSEPLRIAERVTEKKSGLVAQVPTFLFSKPHPTPPTRVVVSPWTI